MARKERKHTAIDLFCGSGGLTQGLRDAGFKVVAAVDSDPLSVATYKRNQRRVRVWQKPIQELEPSILLESIHLAPGSLDLLAGCPPCQAFSSMRRLNGRRRVQDRSKDLVFEFIRFVEEMLPKVIMMENVPRLAQDHRMGEVRKRLRALGYEGQPAVMNAAEYGVPQRRRRMIYIASRIGVIDYAPPIEEEARLTVSDAIRGLPHPRKSDDPLHAIVEARSERVKELIRKIPRDGGSRMDLGEKAQLKCHRRCDGFKDVYGRMAWDDVSPTITGGCVNPSKGRFLHPSQNRAITPREAALLQSFPHDYFFPMERGKFAAAQLIGNAFPPAFARAHAEQIAAHLNKYIQQC